MNIKYCTDDFLEEFKTNFDSYISMYRDKDKHKILELFNFEDIKEGKIKFEYKALKTSRNSLNPERENIKIIYESLNHLTPVQASQEKLWVAMYNTYYIDHLFDYIDLNENEKNFETRLKGSVVFTHGVNRSLIVQNLSRMWWLGYYLYDDNNKDNPYELLDFYTSIGDIVGRSTVFFSSNLTANENLRFGIIEGIRELVEAGDIKHQRIYYTNINKYFNLIGGVKILDIMTRDRVRSKTIEYLRDFK